MIRPPPLLQRYGSPLGRRWTRLKRPILPRTLPLYLWDGVAASKEVLLGRSAFRRNAGQKLHE